MSANVLTVAALVLATWWSGEHRPDAVHRQLAAQKAKAVAQQPLDVTPVPVAAPTAAGTAALLPVAWPAEPAARGEVRRTAPATNDRPSAAPGATAPAHGQP